MTGPTICPIGNKNHNKISFTSEAFNVTPCTSYNQSVAKYTYKMSLFLIQVFNIDSPFKAQKVYKDVPTLLPTPRIPSHSTLK